MVVSEFEIPGLAELVTERYVDERGYFMSSMRTTSLAATIGCPLFPVEQVSHSSSRKGVVRGLHYSATPPGMAKYVFCSYGKALDIVVDVRVGSPTFGRSSSFVLDPTRPSSLYIGVGLGHMFVALEDQTVMNYLMSKEYRAEDELALAPFDPDLRLDIEFPPWLEPTLSERDARAPSLAVAQAAELLPNYETCSRLERNLRRPHHVKDC